LDLAAREGHKSVGLQEIEHALAQEIRYDADVISEIEAFSEMYAFVSILFVVHGQSGENPQFYLGCIPILLDRPNDLDRAFCIVLSVVRFHNLAESSLAQELDDLI
jgi:hypothetical protein